MKKLTLLIALLIAVQSFGFSQGCLPDGIAFTTQAEIDSFQTNYPNCTEIEGDVYIGYYYGTDISNLNGLHILTSIGGNLNIINNDALSSLSGLENLTSIGGNLVVRRNAALASLTGLEDVTSIGGDLNIKNNDALTSLTGLEGLTSIGGDLTIGGYGDYGSGNDALTSLSGLDNINPGSLTNVDISNNNLLTTCNSQWLCDYLMNPNGTIRIYDNAEGCNSVIELAMYCGNTLPCLPQGDYYFYSQSDIDNFQNVFPGCTALEGNLIIRGNDIYNLTGLGQVTSIRGNLSIESNYALTSLSGLEGLTSIGGNLYIESNSALTSLSGLERLTSIKGYFSLSDNYVLTSLNGLEGLTSIEGNFEIYFNSLISLSGLEGLDSIGGELYFYHNDALTSLTGLEGLTSIGGDLNIESNAALISLTGLEGLTSTGGISLYNNAALTSLSGLENIDAGTISGLSIQLNLNLSECAARSICDYLASPDAEISISDNAEGCNSVPQVEEECESSDVQENEINNLKDKVWLSPNPFTTSTTIEYELLQNTTVHLIIYNDLGEQVDAFARGWQGQGRYKFLWRPGNLLTGIYYCVLRTDKGLQTAKMIKMK